MSVREPLLGWIVALVCLVGCSAEPTPLQVGVPSTAETLADWDDLQTAVDAGASKAQMTILRSEKDGNAVVYHLVTVLDRPAVLRVEPGDDGVVRLSARVGRFGDPRREKELLEWVSRRLEELHGVETRSLDWLPPDIKP